MLRALLTPKLAELVGEEEPERVLQLLTTNLETPEVGVGLVLGFKGFGLRVLGLGFLVVAVGDP